MIKWAPYIFVRITICFGAGILWQIYSGHSFNYLPGWLAVFICLFSGLHLLRSRLANHFFTQLAGLTGLCTIFLFGNLITQQRTQSYAPDHLVHQKQNIRYYTGVINDFVVEKPNHYNIVLRVNQVRVASGWQPATGNIMLMLRKEAAQTRPQYGQVMLVQGSPVEPAPPLNPYAFNYRQYPARNTEGDKAVTNAYNHIIPIKSRNTTNFCWRVRASLLRRIFKNQNSSATCKPDTASTWVVPVRV